MEIVDFIRGRWLALVIAAPLIAGVIAYLVISAVQSERYEASGRVAVSQAVPGEIQPQSLDNVVDAFVLTVESTETSRAINEELGTTVAEASAALTVTPTVADFVEISFVADSPENAEQGVEVAARSGLFGFLERENQRTAARAEAARDRVEVLSAELAAIEAEVGAREVAEEYRNLGTDILSLRNQVATASVTQPPVAAALQEVLAAKQAERARLGTALTEYDRVRGALEETTATLVDAESELARIDSLLTAARGDGAVASLQVLPQSSFAATVRATVAAMVGALAAVVLGAILINRRNDGLVRSQSRAEAPVVA